MKVKPYQVRVKGRKVWRVKVKSFGRWVSMLMPRGEYAWAYSKTGILAYVSYAFGRPAVAA